MSDKAIHLGSGLDPATLESLADFICGDQNDRYPVYRSSSFLTRFFQGQGIDATHDGSTRKWWVLDVLQRLKPADLERVLLRLVDLREYKGNRNELAMAVRSMNEILAMDGMGVDFQGTTPLLVRAEPIAFTASDLKVGSSSDSSAQEFLEVQFSDDLRAETLGLDSVLTEYVQARIDEVRACPRHKVPLGTIFLLGSTLEGILLGFAALSPRTFMSASAAPKDPKGKVAPIHEWKLAQLIDVAHSLGMLNRDVQKFSHVLRDFRNYIHPHHQMSQGFMPDQHTVDICWQVFKAAFAQLGGDVMGTSMRPGAST